VLLAWALTLGAIIGSFLNVLIHRLPLGQNIAWPSSYCPHCHTPLKLWHNIPILSWLLLRGRCGYCGAPIGVRYIAVEIASITIFGSSYWLLGASLDALLFGVVFALLLALSLIDWRYKAVPDSLNLTILAFALFANGHPLIALWYGLLFAGGFAMLRFVLSYYLYGKLRFLARDRLRTSWLAHYDILPSHEAMGEADIIVAATIGALLGVELGVIAIFLAALLSLPVALYRRHEDVQTPFVPFLALGAFVTFVMHEPLLRMLEAWYA